MVNRLFTRVRTLDRAEVIGLSIVSVVCLLVGLSAALAFTPSAAATFQSGRRSNIVPRAADSGGSDEPRQRCARVH